LRSINGYRSQEMDVRCSAIHTAIHTVTRPSAIQVPKRTFRGLMPLSQLGLG